MWNRESTGKGNEAGESRVAQPESPALPVEERRVVAWVGRSVIFKGTLISSEDMTIDGHVEGTIEARDQGLTVGPNANIHADIVAKTVTIHGAVIGSIRASAKVDVRATGRIDGSLVAPRVVIAEGALVRGRVDTLTGPSDATKLEAQLANA